MSKTQVLLLILLQIMDVLTTFILYYMSGCNPGIESNPVGRWLINGYGIAALGILKVPATVLVVLIVWCLPHHMSMRMMDFINGAMLFVVINNFLQFQYIL